LGDICGKQSVTSSVRIAIESEGGGEHKARIIAQLTTQMANQPTTLKSELSWSANEWIQVAIAYSGHEFFLYINGARVAKSRKQVQMLNNC
uniref:DUF2341 domain-containing protein n=1 Tax=Anisakis simplex TaxID=6269 RepID=A0A0M3KG71_ANISI